MTGTDNPHDDPQEDPPNPPRRTLTDHNTLTRNRAGRWIESAPAECPNHHPTRPGQVIVGTHVCSCPISHHRTHRCRECNAITYTPSLGNECTDASFDGRARQDPTNTNS